MVTRRWGAYETFVSSKLTTGIRHSDLETFLPPKSLYVLWVVLRVFLTPLTQVTTPDVIPVAFGKLIMSHRSNFLRDRSRDPGTRVCDDMPRKLDSLGQKENHQVNLDMMITDSTHVIPRRQNRPLSQLTLSGWYVTSPLVPSFFGKVTHNWYYVDR